MSSVKIVKKGNDGDNGIVFSQIEDDKVKNQILTDIINAINKGITDGNVEDAIKKLGKKLDLDVQTDPTNKLKNSLSTIVSVYKTFVDTMGVIDKFEKETSFKNTAFEMSAKFEKKFNQVLTDMVAYYHGLDKIEYRFADDFVSNRDELKNFYNNIKEFKDINEQSLIGFKGKLAKIKVVDKSGNNVGNFESLNDNAKNDVLNGYADLFNYVKNNNSYKKLVDIITFINNQSAAFKN